MGYLLFFRTKPGDSKEKVTTISARDSKCLEGVENSAEKLTNFFKSSVACLINSDGAIYPETTTIDLKTR